MSKPDEGPIYIPLANDLRFLGLPFLWLPLTRGDFFAAATGLPYPQPRHLVVTAALPAANDP